MTYPERIFGRWPRWRDAATAPAVRARAVSTRARAVWAIWPALLVAHSLAAVAVADDDATRPVFAVLAQAIRGHFQAQEGYEPGDLISQRDVAAAIAVAVDVGWDVPDAEAVVSLALPDDSFLVREFATPAGRKFMRKIARQPGAYPRTDRLSTISGGEALIRRLIRDPGGEKLIQYLATTQGGKNLGKMMASAQHGVDLNQPTGRIYTADDLLAVLKRLYDGAES